MPNPTHFSRRERQIMDVVFSKGEATVNEVCAKIPDAPTDMAVRRMMHILEEKGHLCRRQQGREVVYLPSQSKARAGLNALQGVLDTFFDGALDDALAAHLTKKESVTDEQLTRMRALIDRAKKEGR